MKIYKLIFFFILFCFFSAGSAFSSHIMGGEITWACQGNGSYIFQMRIYRDCNGIAMPLPVALRVHNHPTLTSIPMNLVSSADISPQCDGAGPTINCGMGNQWNPVAGAVQEFVFQSNPIFISGVPPVQGWVFTWDNCCRNNAILNLNSAGQYGITLRSVMYSYNGQNTNPCYDSSPTFMERPATIICGGTPYTYNHNAFDSNLDSLVYTFGQPLDYLNGGPFSGVTPLVWANNFSQNIPLPSTAQNAMNVPATMDSQTGEISFQSFTFGSFVSVVSAKSYKCGVLVAEVFREIQIVILNCGANNPPMVTPPFQDPQTLIYNLFTDTVDAGDFVSFTMTATDNEFLPTGWPQTISISASGGQFGTNFTDSTSGCAFPPCATLTPPPPASSAGSTTIEFNWQTTCDHISYDPFCYSVKNLHSFIIIFKDNYCPAPSYKAATVTIVVRAKPVVGPPDFRCTAVQPNGDATLTWIPPLDTGNTFESYVIYSASNINGPYTLVDSIYNLNQTTYTDIGAGANLGSVYYYIKTRSGCNGKVTSFSSDTLRTMYISAANTGPNINVTWNSISSPLPATANGIYDMRKQIAPNPFSNLYLGPLTTYQDNFQTCTASINYQVQMPDQSGCISYSNIYYGNFQNAVPPSIPVFDSVSVNLGSQLTEMGWQTSIDTDVTGYIILQLINGVLTPIDTVMGLNSSYFSNPNSTPGVAPETYAIMALDNCNNLSDTSVLMNTLFIQCDVKGCLGLNNISWNTYNGWVGGVQSYQIFASENGLPYQLVGSVPGNQNIFSHTNLNTGSTYCYVIRANSVQGYSSTSQKVCIQADVLNIPDFLYLNVATVEPDQRAVVKCFFDTTSDLKVLKLLRSLAGVGIYDTIADMNLDWTTGKAWFTDIYAVTSSQSYDYKVIQIDNCYNVSAVSNVGRTMLIQGKSYIGFINKGLWNGYIDWPTGVEKYHLYRMQSDGSSLQQIATITNGSLNFTDDVSAFDYPSYEYCYYAEAFENLGNPYGFKDTSRSNVICLLQTPTVYIPNAFYPDGFFNTTFGPQGIFARDLKSYSLEVYNRWGERIFRTEDYKTFWDGKYREELCQQGVYVYRLIMQFENNKEIDERGIVNLLR